MIEAYDALAIGLSGCISRDAPSALPQQMTSSSTATYDDGGPPTSATLEAYLEDLCSVGGDPGDAVASGFVVHPQPAARMVGAEIVSQNDAAPMEFAAFVLARADCVQVTLLRGTPLVARLRLGDPLLNDVTGPQLLHEAGGWPTAVDGSLAVFLHGSETFLGVTVLLVDSAQPPFAKSPQIT